MANIQYDCPHCGTRRAGFVYISEYSLSESENVVFCKCPICRNGLILNMLNSTGLTISKVLGQIDPSIIGQYLSVKISYPKPVSSKLPEGIPDACKSSYEKALTDFDEKRYEQACMLFRKTLDLATKQMLGEEAKNKTLNDRIKSLAASGKLTQDLASWAHEIRSAGNDFVHEDDPTEKDALDMELLTRLLMMYVYSLPKMLNERKILPKK